MFSLRWEIVPLHRPWSAPEASVLLPPIASGVIVRNDIDSATGQKFFDPASPIFGNAEPITVPAAPDGAPWLLLVIEVFGRFNWMVRVGEAQTAPPIEQSGGLGAFDPYPGFIVPASTLYDAITRSRETRAIKPGSIFQARPVTTLM